MYYHRRPWKWEGHRSLFGTLRSSKVCVCSRFRVRCSGGPLGPSPLGSVPSRAFHTLVSRPFHRPHASGFRARHACMCTLFQDSMLVFGFSVLYFHLVEPPPTRNCELKGLGHRVTGRHLKCSERSTDTSTIPPSTPLRPGLRFRPASRFEVG